MKRRIRVAAIQMEIKMLDVQANLERAEKLLKTVFESDKCDLVVFPEYFITGPIPYNLELVQHESSPSIKLFQKLAAFYKTYIVCGSVLKKINGDYFNTSFLIDDQGEIILEYQKINLWHPERRYVTPGEEVKMVRTPIGNIGIIICWDLAFPEVCQRLVKMGADIICCPSYWAKRDGVLKFMKYIGEDIPAEENIVNTLCPARAIENEVLFIYANGGGKAEVRKKSTIWESSQIGQTQICVPIFGTVAKLSDNKEGFITYEFDREVIHDAEKAYKIKEDLFLK